MTDDMIDMNQIFTMQLLTAKFDEGKMTVNVFC